MDFLERFMGVDKRLSDLGVDGWAMVARCSKIQVEAEKKSVCKAWLVASRRKAVLVRTNTTESNLPSSAHHQFPTVIYALSPHLCLIVSVSNGWAPPGSCTLADALSRTILESTKVRMP